MQWASSCKFLSCFEILFVGLGDSSGSKFIVVNSANLVNSSKLVFTKGLNSSNSWLNSFNTQSMNSSKTLHSSKDWIRRTAGVDLDKTDVEFIEILGPPPHVSGYFVSANFSLRIQNFPRPHAAYLNRICPTHTYPNSFVVRQLICKAIFGSRENFLVNFL